MPRGPLLKTLVKKEKALAKARLETEQKFLLKSKTDPKTFLFSLKERFEASIEKIDPIEALAIGSTTLLVHNLILTNDNLIVRVNALTGIGIIAVTEPWRMWLGGIMGYFGLGMFVTPPNTVPPEQLKEFTANAITTWILSFSIAFILVRHMGGIMQAIGSATNGMIGLIGLFI